MEYEKGYLLKADLLGAREHIIPVQHNINVIHLCGSSLLEQVLQRLPI